MSEEICRHCERYNPPFNWWQFKDGSDGFLCEPCEEELLDEYGMVVVE